jgi:hypothetical protein
LQPSASDDRHFIDPARKQYIVFPPISAKNAEMDGAPQQYLVAGSIMMKMETGGKGANTPFTA